GPTGRGNPEQPPHGYEENHAFRVPGAAAENRSIADHRSGTTVRIDSPELAAREKPEAGTVWRPEGCGSPFGAGQRSRVRRIERVQPDLRRRSKDAGRN